MRSQDSKTVSHPESLIPIFHTSNSLKSVCFVEDNALFDGYDNETFLMFVPTICIISSHKLSSDRIRHELDMRTSSSIFRLCLSLMPSLLKKLNLLSTIHSLSQSRGFLYDFYASWTLETERFVESSYCCQHKRYPTLFVASFAHCCCRPILIIWWSEIRDYCVSRGNYRGKCRKGCGLHSIENWYVWLCNVYLNCVFIWKSAKTYPMSMYM